MMAHHSDPTSLRGKTVQVFPALSAQRKPRILLAACGSVAAAKFGIICNAFLEWAEVKAVVTKSSLRFIDRVSIPMDVTIYTDDQEWFNWKLTGDDVPHIALSTWADIMVIAPLSAHALAKIAGGMCDNLLTSAVRAWDYNKPLFVAPSMNRCTWRNPFNEQHCMTMEELGIIVIPPAISQRSKDREYQTGAMADPSVIYSSVRHFYEVNVLKKTPGYV